MFGKTPATITPDDCRAPSPGRSEPACGSPSTPGSKVAACVPVWWQFSEPFPKTTFQFAGTFSQRAVPSGRPRALVSYPRPVGPCRSRVRGSRPEA